MSNPTGWIFIVLSLAALLGIGALVGWWFAYQRLDKDVEQVDQQKAELDEQWDTLQRTQRVNEKFWEARQALRAEAQRAQQAQRYSWGHGQE